MSYAELVRAASDAARRGDDAEARAFLARAIEMRPNFAPLLGNHADACLRLGDKRDALNSLERYLELDQSKPEVALAYIKLAGDLNTPIRRDLLRNTGKRWLKQLLPQPLRARAGTRSAAILTEAEQGVALDKLPKREAAAIREARDHLIRGRAAEAQAIAQRLPKTEISRPALLQLQGRIHAKLGQDADAAALFGEALTLTPDDPALHSDLLQALVDAGRLGSAEAALAALPDPLRSSAELGLAEAQLLYASGRPDAALEVVERVADRPELAAKRCELLALILSSFGRFDEAQTYIERLVALRPGSARPFAIAAQNRRLAPGSGLYAAAEALLADHTAPQEVRAGVAFALGAALRAAGEHEMSFDRIQQGNRLADRLYDREVEERDFETLKRVFTPELLRKAGAGERGRGLVFVVGLPRSGSTLVSQILGRHPDAVSVGEFQGVYLCLAQARELGYPERAPAFSDEDLASLAETYLRELPAPARAATFVIDKELNKFIHLGLMRMIFPAARFVHMRRDPMDVCFSIYSHLFEGAFAYARRQETLAHFHRLHDDLMRHWYGTLGDAVYECSYERLVADPGTEIPRLLQGAGMSFHEACLRPEESDFVPPTSSIHQARQGIYRSSTGSWKRHADRLSTLSSLL